MVELRENYAKFKNLLDVQRELQYETITATFTEGELKSILFYLGELIALHEAYEESTGKGGE